MKPPKYKISVKRPGSNKWEVFENIIGDTTYLAVDKKFKIAQIFPIKVLFLESNERVEIGMGPGVIIKYSVERYYNIKENMSNEAGEDVKTVQ